MHHPGTPRPSTPRLLPAQQDECPPLFHHPGDLTQELEGIPGLAWPAPVRVRPGRALPDSEPGTPEIFYFLKVRQDLLGAFGVKDLQDLQDLQDLRDLQDLQELQDLQDLQL